MIDKIKVLMLDEIKVLMLYEIKVLMLDKIIVWINTNLLTEISIMNQFLASLHLKNIKRVLQKKAANSASIKKNDEANVNITVDNNNENDNVDTSDSNIQNNVDIVQKIINEMTNNNKSSILDTVAKNNQGNVDLLRQIADKMGIANNVKIISTQKTDGSFKRKNIDNSSQKTEGRSKRNYVDDCSDQQSKRSKHDEYSLQSHRSIPDELEYSSNTNAEIKTTSSQKNFEIEMILVKNNELELRKKVNVRNMLHQFLSVLTKKIGIIMILMYMILMVNKRSHFLSQIL